MKKKNQCFYEQVIGIFDFKSIKKFKINPNFIQTLSTSNIVSNNYHQYIYFSEARIIFSSQKRP